MDQAVLFLNGRSNDAHWLIDGLMQLDDALVLQFTNHSPCSQISKASTADLKCYRDGGYGDETFLDGYKSWIGTFCSTIKTQSIISTFYFSSSEIMVQFKWESTGNEVVSAFPDSVRDKTSMLVPFY